MKYAFHLRHAVLFSKHTYILPANLRRTKKLTLFLFTYTNEILMPINLHYKHFLSIEFEYFQKAVMG